MKRKEVFQGVVVFVVFFIIGCGVFNKQRIDPQLKPLVDEFYNICSYSGIDASSVYKLNNIGFSQNSNTYWGYYYTRDSATYRTISLDPELRKEDNFLKVVLYHELLHSLGVGHDTINKNSIMSPQIDILKYKKIYKDKLMINLELMSCLIELKYKK